MYAEVKLFVLILLVVLFGCGDSMKRHQEAVQNSVVTLNLSAMEQLQSDFIADRENVSADSSYRFVVYLDSSQCVSCRISHIGMWHRFAHIQDRTAIRFLFIIHPSPDDVAELRSLCSDIRYNIYLDSLGVFERDNELLVKKSMASAFLIDGDNRIVFLGDPTEDLKTQEAYQDLVDSLTQNH